MKKLIAAGLSLILLFCGTVCAEIWYDEEGLIHDDEWQNPPDSNELLYQLFSDMAQQQRDQTREQMRNQYGEQYVEQFNQIAKCRSCNGNGRCRYCGGSGRAGTDDYLGRDMYSGSCSYCTGSGQCQQCFGSGQAF